MSTDTTKPRLTATHDPQQQKLAGYGKDVTHMAVSTLQVQGKHFAGGQLFAIREVRTAAPQHSRPISLTGEQLNPSLHRLGRLGGLEMAEGLVKQHISSWGIRLDEDLSGRRKRGSVR